MKSYERGGYTKIWKNQCSEIGKIWKQEGRKKYDVSVLQELGAHSQLD